MLALYQCFLYTCLYTSVLHLTKSASPAHRCFCDLCRISTQLLPKVDCFENTCIRIVLATVHICEKCCLCFFSFWYNMRTLHLAHHFLNCTYAACTVQVISLITYSVRIIAEQLTSLLAERCDVWTGSTFELVVVVSATTEITASEPQASIRLDPGQLAKFDRACHSATSPCPLSQPLDKTRRHCQEILHTGRRSCHRASEEMIGFPNVGRKEMSRY